MKIRISVEPSLKFQKTVIECEFEVEEEKMNERIDEMRLRLNTLAIKNCEELYDQVRLSEMLRSKK